METAHPILGNPLLLAAILLFLAILPRALRQRKKTALDRAVERFEKEELKIAAKAKLEVPPAKEEPPAKKEMPAPPEDRPLDYLLADQLMPTEVPAYGGIPPFRDPSKIDNQSKKKNTKGGNLISHNRQSDPPQSLRKKSKLVKQEISIAPDKNREALKKTPSDPVKENTEKTQTTSKEPTIQNNLSDLHINDETSAESDDNWVEAEIPGLIMDPLPAPEASENIPTFKASPKPEDRLQTKKPLKEKQSSKVKNLAPHSEEKKDPKPQDQTEIEADLPDIAIEISDSRTKQVEFDASVVSHKKTTDTESELKAAESSSSKAGQPEAKAAARNPQKPLKTSLDKARPKPFFLDLKFLAREENETAPSVSRGHLSADQVDEVIDRLNTLQTELEQQLISIPRPLTAEDNLTNENQEKERTRASLFQSERSTNNPTGNTQVSLDELDSFLFTARQRKNRG